MAPHDCVAYNEGGEAYASLPSSFFDTSSGAAFGRRFYTRKGNNMTDEELITDIKLARQVFEENFTPSEEDSIFKSGWEIKYPDPDRAIATPSSFGTKIESCAAEYHLCWDRNMLYWEPLGILIRRELGLPNTCARVYVRNEPINPLLVFLALRDR